MVWFSPLKDKASGQQAHRHRAKVRMSVEPRKERPDVRGQQVTDVGDRRPEVGELTDESQVASLAHSFAPWVTGTVWR